MKITITIEDIPGNKVKCVMEPTFETMMKRNVSTGENFTSAEGYAIGFANWMRQKSRENARGNLLDVHIPLLDAARARRVRKPS